MIWKKENMPSTTKIMASKFNLAVNSSFVISPAKFPQNSTEIFNFFVRTSVFHIIAFQENMI